jgi:hypothetical protein
MPVSHDAPLSGRLRFSHRQITTGYTFNRFLPASPYEFLKVKLAGFSAHRRPVMYSPQLAELVVQRALSSWFDPRRSVSSQRNVLA